jgi:hypothetical protein
MKFTCGDIAELKLTHYRKRRTVQRNKSANHSSSWIEISLSYWCEIEELKRLSDGGRPGDEQSKKKMLRRGGSDG